MASAPRTNGLTDRTGRSRHLSRRDRRRRPSGIDSMDRQQPDLRGCDVSRPSPARACGRGRRPIFDGSTSNGGGRRTTRPRRPALDVRRERHGDGHSRIGYGLSGGTSAGHIASLAVGSDRRRPLRPRDVHRRDRSARAHRGAVPAARTSSGLAAIRLSRRITEHRRSFRRDDAIERAIDADVPTDPRHPVVHDPPTAAARRPGLRPSKRTRHTKPQDSSATANLGSRRSVHSRTRQSAQVRTVRIR